MNFMLSHPVAEDEDDGRVTVPHEVEDAIRTLLRWAGDDPMREGLMDTPKRVGRAWREYCAGYQEDPSVHLKRTFEEVAGYDEVVLLRDIPFHSHCEHHLAPIVGTASIAYLPTDRVVGISKIAKVVEIFAKRLQTQELMTQQIADTIERVLAPKGVAVIIDANHECMSTRGVHKTESTTVTTQMRGLFKTDRDARAELMRMVTSSDIGA